MYYVMSYEIPQDDEGGYFDLEDGLDFHGIDSWSLGRRFEVELAEPIIVELTVVDGYTGPPSDLYDGNMCLMSARLVQVLEEAGVDNLQTFRALLRNSNTGETHDYRAVNIVGAIAAADLSASNWTSHDPDPRFDVNFDALAVDATAARGAMLFRLAENTGVILVHERLRDRLQTADFPNLVFAEPGQWVT
jgi:hypothetical protein